MLGASMVAHLSLLPSAWQQWSRMLSFRMAAPCAMTAEHKHVLALAHDVSLACPSSISIQHVFMLDSLGCDHLGNTHSLVAGAGLDHPSHKMLQVRSFTALQYLRMTSRLHQSCDCLSFVCHGVARCDNQSYCFILVFHRVSVRLLLRGVRITTVGAHVILLVLSLIAAFSNGKVIAFERKDDSGGAGRQQPLGTHNSTQPRPSGPTS